MNCTVQCSVEKCRAVECCVVGDYIVGRWSDRYSEVSVTDHSTQHYQEGTVVLLYSVITVLCTVHCYSGTSV